MLSLAGGGRRGRCFGCLFSLGGGSFFSHALRPSLGSLKQTRAGPDQAHGSHADQGDSDQG